MGVVAKRKGKRFTIRFTVVGIFILATVVTAVIAIGLQYYFSKTMATESALKYYNQASQSASTYLSQIDIQANNVTKLLSSFDSLIENDKFNPESIDTFAEVMRSNPLFYAIYVGLPNGDFYELINLDAHPIIRSQLEASHLDRWVTIEIKGEGRARSQYYQYLDEEFNLRASRQKPSEYDARLRPWFTDANRVSVNKTEPYLFQHLQAPGQTYSIKLPNSDTVLAVDIALSTLSDYLIERGDQSQVEAYLYKASGELIASNRYPQLNTLMPKGPGLSLTVAQRDLIANTPELLVSNEIDWAPIDFTISGEPEGYSIDLLRMVAESSGLKFNFVNGFTWNELVDSYTMEEIDMLHSIMLTDKNETLGEFSESFLDLHYAIVTQPENDTITRLSELNGKRLAIPKGWSIIQVVSKAFPDIEIVELASTQAILQAVEDGEVFAALDNSVILHYTAQSYFIDRLKYHETISFGDISVPTGLHMVMQGKNVPLIDIINLAISNITSEQRDALAAKWFAHGELQSFTPQGIVPYEVLIDMAADPKQQNQLISTKINGIEQFIYVTSFGEGKAVQDKFAIVVPASILLASSKEKVSQSILITALCLLLVLPISWVFASPIIRPIKALAIENEKIRNRRYDEVVNVNSSIAELDELASSMWDMSESIQLYERNQKELMESFIKLIAQAIDDKSPYTAGHCNRVPELGLMLADAAAKSDLAPFKDFSFKTADEHREFRIAAWLHDCGKITTPEFIVDKGTKLEVVYNRIHEVRMRFEVLWRDAEIDYLKRLSSTESRQELTAELENKRLQLKQDFEFIANANVGGEFMDQAHKDRLAELAEITWQRNFDDRLGLSPIEELNLSDVQSTESYPVTETLLRDKPEHIIKRINKVEFDPKFGIKMDVPEHQYNLGELYNLSISRGTLTAEDRFKINEHVISTIKMLETLPFPPELAKVPRYASTHHETLKGTGYPRRLSAEDLSIPERILVVADIFEALTAADRPYKKAKPLSVAIDILHKMALDEHLDIEVFRLFLTSGIYLEYAHKFLDAKQINEVDVAKYLSDDKKLKNA
ncbi:HD domain-containing phosphohydrolase [Shewanella sp.]|uniref:HD domain-containing phosphohydrolase n=1 Tax=Shewanella sp. TaxID=50422 RepID=UPI00259070E0|nr:HD domain-containing phosphohydrolase [Shewanella sp.]MCJ8301395.1 transporter substrate-binding domain-containing protein [Shewanella sp.]